MMKIRRIIFRCITFKELYPLYLFHLANSTKKMKFYFSRKDIFPLLCRSYTCIKSWALNQYIWKYKRKNHLDATFIKSLRSTYTWNLSPFLCVFSDSSFKGYLIRIKETVARGFFLIENKIKGFNKDEWYSMKHRKIKQQLKMYLYKVQVT